MVPGQRHASVHPEPVSVCLNLQQMYPVADCCSSLICYWRWLQRRSLRHPMSEVVWCAVVLWCKNGIHIRHPALFFKHQTGTENHIEQLDGLGEVNARPRDVYTSFTDQSCIGWATFPICGLKFTVVTRFHNVWLESSHRQLFKCFRKSVEICDRSVVRWVMYWKTTFLNQWNHAASLVPRWKNTRTEWQIG